VIKRVGEADEFDFNGKFFQLAGVKAFPKPFGGTRPIIMNAGSTPTGQAFALRNCDAFFTATSASRTSMEASAKKVAEIKTQARGFGREIAIYTVGQVVCRASQNEADEYYRHAVVENADWSAIDGMLALKNITPKTISAEEYAAKRNYFASNAIGGYPFVGTPDRVAEELANIAKAGMTGIAVSFVNYLNEVPYFANEVLPRLARLGVRQTH
jgi:alkanesulfonate monooxygenase SsuD/methylene tetrahydromethanopterin reductase-like flavin-dependent oxidoreductase (luciferase family)